VPAVCRVESSRVGLSLVLNLSSVLNLSLKVDWIGLEY
jgi:hypothetical protein